MGWGFVYCQYPCCLGQVRFVVAVFALFAVILGYCQRASLNIGLVEMVEHKNSSEGPTCPVETGKSTTISDIGGGRVKWSKEEENYNLSAFYIGYVISHIPAGILCDRYGPRWPLFCGMLLSTVSTALIPIGATGTDYWWVVAILRIFTGLGQGALFPGITSLMGRWIPPVERATIGAIVFAAHGFGLVIGNVCTGLLIVAVKNWPIAFYMWASIGVVYLLLYLVYAFSDPRTHPLIHPVEFGYLQETMVFKQTMVIPWGGILSDKSLYGLIIVQLGHDLIMFTLANNLPSYMNQVLGLDLQSNALVSFIFLLQWISGLFTGMLSDFLVKKKNANVTFMRKLYTIISNFGSWCFLCMAVLIKCRTYFVIGCFAIAIFFKGIYFAGGKVNIMDISINHTGLVMSIVNGVGALMGWGCSFAIGKIVTRDTFAQWHIIIGGIGGIEVVTLIFYVALSSADRSKWDYLEGEEPPPKKTHPWYKQMTNSDHEIRLAKDKQSNATKNEAAAAAKAKMKEDLRNRMGKPETK